MSRPRPQYVHREKTRHGKIVWYYRKGHGKRHSLPGPPGCEGFDAALKAAQAADEAALPNKTRRHTATKGSIRWLFDEYQLLAEFQDLEPVTQANRRAIWNKVCDTPVGKDKKPFGDMHPNSLTQNVIQKAVDKRTAWSAHGFMKAMRPPMKWAARSGHIKANPTLGIEMPKNKSTGYHIWTAAEVETYRNHWPLGTMERFILELALWTGLRRADLVRLGPQHRRSYDDGDLFEILCDKTRKSSGVMAYIPVVNQLEVVLEHYPVRAMAYLTGKRGNPLTPIHCGNIVEAAAKAAGVPGRLHGLRKSLASLYAEWGITNAQLNAMFAWTTNKQSEVYTRGADRRKLALDAGKVIKSRTSIPAPSSKSART